MKSINVLGNRIPILAVIMGLLVVGTASAAVVNYLSNMEEAEVEVTSPFTVLLSADDPDGSTFVDWESPGTALDLDPKVGGETSTFWIKYENHADQPIEMQIETLISCDEGFGMYAPGSPLNGHIDFEDDQHTGNYEENVAHGIMLDITSPDLSLVVSNIPVNHEDESHYRPIAETLAVVGGMADFGASSSFWPQWFPANEYAIVEVTLHHAPNAIGVYTITTEVQDDKAGWVP